MSGLCRSREAVLHINSSILGALHGKNLQAPMSESAFMSYSPSKHILFSVFLLQICDGNASTEASYGTTTRMNFFRRAFLGDMIPNGGT